jgi:ubiquinone/menaquinone biosynthesis C-methylase UbiE
MVGTSTRETGGACWSRRRPGDTGFLAAKHLGSGRFVSTDLSPEMVEVARQRGAELGIQNADYRVLDAQAMDLADASFDGVLCR